MVKVSVVITTHNRPQLLPRAVSSAKRAGRDVEVIVVDDASAEETARICRSLAGIRYIRVDCNQRVAGARNIGLVASRGEYVTFLDDDDLRLTNSLAEQVELLEQDPNAAFVYGRAIPETANGGHGAAYPLNCLQGDLFWQLLTRNFIPCGSVVFRRSVVEKVGLLDDAIAGIDDWDFWVRIAELFPVIAIESPTIVWRQSSPASTQGSSDTVAVIAQARRHFRRVFRKLPRFAAAPRIDRQRAWRKFSTNVSEHLAWETFCALRRGEISQALRSVRLLLSLHPAGLWLVLRRWINVGTIPSLINSAVSPAGLMNGKIYFKRQRSKFPDDENNSLQKSF